MESSALSITSDPASPLAERGTRAGMRAGAVFARGARKAGRLLSSYLALLVGPRPVSRTGAFGRRFLPAYRAASTGAAKTSRLLRPRPSNTVRRGGGGGRLT